MADTLFVAELGVITLSVTNPTIHVVANTSHEVELLELLLSIEEPTIHVVANTSHEVELLELLLSIETPIEIGGSFGTTIVPATLSIKMTLPYIQLPISIGVLLEPLVLTLTPTIQPITESFAPILPNIGFKLLSCSVFTGNECDTPRRVIALDDVFFDKPMYWSDNHNKFVSSTEVTENGDTIHFVMPLSQFTQRQEVSTDETMSMRYTTARSLLSKLNDEVHILRFDDASFEEFKFDLLNIPIVAKPIYEGSNRVYITIKVLV